MSSSLPTESSSDKVVDTFGLGTYDGTPLRLGDGEDSNARPGKETLPKDPGHAESSPVSDPDDRLVGYPETFASAILPGDSGREPSGWLRKRDLVRNVPSVSQSIPTGGPRTVTDYGDPTVINSSIDDMWAKDDTGAYVSQESLPAPVRNDKGEETLPGLGNSWSGVVEEDVSGPLGHPSDAFGLTDTDGSQRTYASEHRMNRTATNFSLVRELTSGFLKKAGKKGLTRRHVMAFLTESGRHQYLASDVIRCLLLDHNVYVKDVLDEFPVAKVASEGSGIARIASVRGELIDMEIDSLRDPEVSSLYRAAAAALTRVLAGLEKVGSDG